MQGNAGAATGVQSVVISSVGESEATADGVTGWSSVQAYALDMGTGALSLEAMAAIAMPCPGTATASASGRYYLLPDVCANRITVTQLALNGSPLAGREPAGSSLEEVSGSPVPTGAGPLAVAQPTTGQFAYVLNHDSSTIGVYKVDHLTGGLKLAATQPVLDRPLTVAIHPSGREVYVGGGYEGRTIAVFSVDPGTGLLSKRFQVSVHDDQRALLTRRFTGAGARTAQTVLYVVTRSAVERFDISRESESPRWLQAARLPSGDHQAAAIVSAGYLYVANPDSIAAFAMDPSDGSLAPVQGAPFRADTASLWYESDWEEWPADTQFAMLSAASGLSGRYLFVSNQKTRTLSSYAVDAETGTIQPLPWSPRRLGSRPTSVVVVGGGQS